MIDLNRFRQQASYVGVTGFTNGEEVKVTLAAMPAEFGKDSESWPKRLLMVGVLASWKSLRGLPMNPMRQKRSPAPEKIHKIFQDNPLALNLVHYNSEAGEEYSLVSDMLELHGFSGGKLHGFQLNMAWPDARALTNYRNIVGTDPRIVLQIGRKAIEMAGGTPEGVLKKLMDYGGTVNDLLFDLSGGLGKPMNVEEIRAYLSEVKHRHHGFRLGVAGGLGPDSMNLVTPLLKEFPGLNIDAEGRLRNAENEMDLNAAQTYIERAMAMIP